jgi:diguanylate cyclase (GGDEF)-like protein/hemerythrin-like metal-binding protein
MPRIPAVAADEGQVAESPIDPRSLGTLLLNSDVVALAVLRGGRIVFANPAFLAAFRASGLAGVAVADIVLDARDASLADALADAELAPTCWVGTGRRDSEPPFDLELRLEPVMLDGEAIVIAFAWDVTQQHRASEHLACLAYTDPLTGLANRALFADHLHQAILHARRDDTTLAVLMADLDGFKAVNDTYGHDAGDVALQIVGQRFLGCVREGDTLARIGGDEFVVLLQRLPDHRAAARVAERMIAALAPPLDRIALSVVIGTSIGIAVWPEHANSLDALLASADTAMYRAKRAGKNRLQWATGRSEAASPSLPPQVWRASHSVGIEEIDDQHLHLLQLVDRLSNALKDSLDADTIAAGLRELIRYTAFHFATEERLMEIHGVDGRDRHRDEHRRLLHDIGALHVDGELASVSLILSYLNEWLLRHVDGLDRQLGQSLLAKGLR